MHMSKVRRLAILRLSAIGDVVHAMPLAMGLRDAFPEAKITWVVQAAAAPLLLGHPAVDDVLLFPRKGGLAGWWRFLGELRKRRLDATVDPQGNMKSALVGLLSGAQLRAGLHVRDCKEWANAVLSNRRGHRPSGPHGVERAWAAGEPLGVRPGADRWGLTATDEELARWRKRCREVGADPDGPLLAINLTNPENNRSWFTDAWAKTVRGVVDAGYQVVLNGRPEVAPVAKELSMPGVFDLVDRDDLRGLLAQLESMAARPGNALVSADSGPVHIAAAVGLFVLCLAGPQDPARTGPRNGASIHAWEGLDCRPCVERECQRRPPDRACMRNLTAERVLEQLLGFAGRGRVQRHELK